MIKLNVKLDNDDGDKITVPFPIDETENVILSRNDETIQKCIAAAMKKFNANVDNVIITASFQVK